MNQPGFDWEAARAARDDGIRRAAQHAEDVTPKWGDRAYAVLIDYLTKPPAFTDCFTSEQVREHGALLKLPDPPHLRAWGGVFQRAARAGVIVKTGTTTAKATNVHCSIIATWRKV